MEDKIDGIPTNDYTSTLSSISTKIDNIPNYTSVLAAIQTAIEGIPTTDYSSELATIEGKIDNLTLGVHTHINCQQTKYAKDIFKKMT